MIKTKIKLEYRKNCSSEELALIDFVESKKSNFIDLDLLNDVKSEFNIDFRSDVFLDNDYGACPCINYDRVENIVIYANNLLQDKYGDIRKWNLGMDVEQMRTCRLKDYLSDLFDMILPYHLLKDFLLNDSKC